MDDDKNNEISFRIIKSEVVERTNYDLVVSFIQRDELLIKLNYNKNVYSSETITTLVSYMQKILDFIIQSPERIINDIELIERKKLEFSANNDISFDID